MGLKRRGVLHNRLAVMRAERGWTQKAVAEKLGVSRQTIHSIEADKYTPSIVLAFELALLFEKEIQELFQYSVEGEDAR